MKPLVALVRQYGARYPSADIWDWSSLHLVLLATPTSCDIRALPCFRL